MASLSDPHQVRQSNLRAKSGLEDEKENRTLRENTVNKSIDAFGRTLLAWQCLMVMHCYMPGNAMRLYVTIRQPYNRSFWR